jgi:hypothetical protein
VFGKVFLLISFEGRFSSAVFIDGKSKRSDKIVFLTFFGC